MNDKKCKVYIASSYTVGDTAVNVKRQLDLASLMLDIGLIPFAPLLTHFVHMANPKPYMTWMNYDFEWISACDAVLRVPGESKGGDMEVDHAEKQDIPVFRHLEQLVSHCMRQGYYVADHGPTYNTLMMYDQIIKVDAELYI